MTRLLLAFLVVAPTYGFRERSSEFVVPEYLPVFVYGYVVLIDQVVGVDGVSVSCDAEDLIGTSRG